MQYSADYTTGQVDHPSILGSARHALATAVASVTELKDALTGRRKLHYMLTLEPHLLDDIGVDQGDILAALNSPWYENPSHALQHYRRRNLQQQEGDNARR